MRMKFIIFPVLALLFLGACKEDEYKVNYDKKKVEMTFQNGTLLFKNMLSVPVILDHIQVNGKETKNFIQYKVCDYLTAKQEVTIDYSEKVNQVISLESILLPGKEKTVQTDLKKGDNVLFEFYPVTWAFLSDNVYFLEKQLRPEEMKYKLHTQTEITNLILSSASSNQKELSGIMIYVKEYDQLTDNLEKKELEY